VTASGKRVAGVRAALETGLDNAGDHPVVRAYWEQSLADLEDIRISVEVLEDSIRNLRRLLQALRDHHRGCPRCKRVANEALDTYVVRRTAS
jgi:hypothetical protein